ncbi:lipid droplet-associated protein [Pseudonocardia sp.]|uniref:lipid droplet-associated protein n=1 Tax=Pseudonocardia sp. TaxID=60912 RepID=UPI00260D9610|nr:lipid droplet-associated protein [Pseudonocardia sp.]MCW2718404.1 hypothetical protein [Pseudonocardia sp.]
MKPLPLPVRIAAGLVATAVDQARDLPRLVVEFPVTAVSQALQASMRVQQKVTELAIKGDRALGVLRPVEEKPSWATFDDEEPPRRNGASTITALRPSSARTPVAQPPASRTQVARPPAAPPRPATSSPATTAPSPSPSKPATSKTTTSTPAKPATSEAPPSKPAPEPPTSPTTATTSTPKAPSTDVPSTEAPATDTPAAAAGNDGPSALTGYQNMTIPQLRGKLRFLSLADLEALLAWESDHGDRAPYVTMLTNRISTVTEN